MESVFVREFKLAGPKGDGRHPYVNEEGAFIGRGVPLLERNWDGRWKARDKAILDRLIGKGYGIEADLGWRMRQLGYVAHALNRRDLCLANISLVRAELPTLPSPEHARAMAKADGLFHKYNPDWGDEPRVPAGDSGGGRWTTDGDDNVSSMKFIRKMKTRKNKLFVMELGRSQRIYSKG